MNALDAFGAPLHQISQCDLAYEGVVFQIGDSPVRIDIVTSIDGVSFQEAHAHRQTLGLVGVQIPVISVEDLIRNKGASGRP